MRDRPALCEAMKEELNEQHNQVVQQIKAAQDRG